ncbi:hypothetical protein Tco_0893971 [Tanacetum coccineum]|uniref:Uncharacterized protein n=1 Tax=Tanacetum coccineum TaxID=301880 RepID=A0ABQ5CBT7_9ASTR
MATMAENVLATGAEIRPPMHEKGCYYSRKSQLKDLSPEEKLRKRYDIKATSIILLGVPVYIYTLVNHHKIASDIWNRVKELMEDDKVIVQNVQGRQAQGNGVNTRKNKAIGIGVINTVGDLKANPPRQQDFLANGLEEFDLDCDDIQLHTTSIFKVDHVDAFDSDCDEAPTANAIFMARLSLTGSVNGDDVSLTYDSEILSKNDAAQSVPPSEQDNAMILSVIEQMQSQVE